MYIAPGEWTNTLINITFPVFSLVIESFITCLYMYTGIY